MTDSALIERLETYAFNAWVAKEIEELGGWYLRSNDGVTRRANSVLPLGNPSIDVIDAIEYVKQFYEGLGIIPRFQLTPISKPEGLDEQLESAGFQLGMKVEIQVAEIEDVVAIPSRWEVEISSQPTKEFLKAYMESSGYDSDELRIRKGIMERTKQESGFATVTIDDQVAGVGIGVIEDDWVGLFGLITKQPHRRAGVSISLNKEIAVWAVNKGASHCYLQVFNTNHPAISLYAKLGFKELYSYWYRVFGTPVMPSY